MAQRGFKTVGDKLCCAICLDLLKDPVTIPCGHNYCMDCIRIQWDEEDQKRSHSCPQCRQTFTPRPALVKNTMLAELVEEHEKSGVQAAPADHCYAGPADVNCDICSGRKLKAIKSCLQCLVSYCEQHLQPHYNVAALKKHKLVSPSEKLQENICTNHNKVMKIFCRTDQQCICYLCSMYEHKGHCIVSAATEKDKRQKELKPCKEKIHQKIKDGEEDMMLIQHRMEAINYSADEAVRHSETIFSGLMLLIEKRSSDIKQQIRSQQETELNRTRELLQQVQQDLSDLERKNAELEELFHTEDLIQILYMFPLFSDICESTLHQAPRIRLPPLVYFEKVVSAVSEMKDELEHILSDRWQKCSQTITDVEKLLPETVSDSLHERVDQPTASQAIRLRKPPSVSLKKSCSRRAGGQEAEEPGISTESADPKHAICPLTFSRPPPTHFAPQAEPKTITDSLQVLEELKLNFDSERVDRPTASQAIRLRKPPLISLKKSCSRRAGGQEAEEPGICTESADPKHAICPLTFSRPPPTHFAPQAEPKTITDSLQVLEELKLNFDSERVDRPTASQAIRLRKPPLISLKKSCSRRAGSQEAEELGIFAETADPEHVIYSPPPTVLDPPIQGPHLRITLPLSSPVQRHPVRTIPYSPPSHPIINTPIIASPIIAPPIITPPILERRMSINGLPIQSEPVRTVPFNLGISRPPPRYY